MKGDQPGRAEKFYTGCYSKPVVYSLGFLATSRFSRWRVMKAYSGFTLIELMIVVVIVAILAVVSYPAYTDYVRKTHRKTAIGEVLDVAAHLERIKSQRFSYLSADAETRSLDRYTLTVTATATTYTITATPDDQQSADPCGTFSYDQASTWTFANSATEADCIQ